MTDTQRGIFLYLIAWTFIPIMDGIAKYLSFNFHVLQIVWARYFFTTIIVLPIILFLYKKNFLSSEKYSLQIVRGTFLVIATLCFFYFKSKTGIGPSYSSRGTG